MDNAEYIYDEAAADKVISFIEKFCKHSKGKFARTPIKLLSWQLDIIKTIFGYKHKDTGLRQYRQCGVWVPRKNGKTTMMAAVALAMLLADDEQGPEVYIVATCREQAAILFDTAWNMIKQSPSLQKHTKIYKAKKQILSLANFGKLAILSSDADANVGQNSSCIIFDELAFIADRNVYVNLRSSMLSRQQPLLLTISTASDKVNPGDIGKEQFDYAVAVRDGQIQDAEFLPVIFQAPPELPWDAPETWKVANPSHGEALDLNELQKLCTEAKNAPIKQAEFEQFHLNRWRFETGCAISKEVWDAAACEFPDLRGRTCFGGLDLARVSDLASTVLVFPIDDCFYLLPRFWTPEDTVEMKERMDRVPYRMWQQNGDINFCEGSVIGDSDIRQSIVADAKTYNIESFGYDPYVAESLCNQQLRLEDDINMVQVRQGMLTMAPPTAAFFKLLTAGKIKHPNHPILNWNAGNVTLITDKNDNAMVAKMRKNNRLKIDGIQAAIVALSLALAGQEEPGQFFVM